MGLFIGGVYGRCELCTKIKILLCLCSDGTRKAGISIRMGFIRGDGLNMK